jgi:hypothetical protein
VPEVLGVSTSDQLAERDVEDLAETGQVVDRGASAACLQLAEGGLGPAESGGEFCLGEAQPGPLGADGGRDDVAEGGSAGHGVRIGRFPGRIEPLSGE